LANFSVIISGIGAKNYNRRKKAAERKEQK